MTRLVSRSAGLDASGTTNESMSTISMCVFLRLECLTGLGCHVPDSPNAAFVLTLGSGLRIHHLRRSEPATAQAAPASVDEAKSAVHSNRLAGAAITRGNHTSSVKPTIMIASRLAASRGTTPLSRPTPAATCAAPVMYAIARCSGSHDGTSAAVSFTYTK